MPTDDEIAALFQRVLKSPSFRRAPMRASLLKYLSENRSEYSRPIDIWQDALEREGPPDEMAVRERCLDLRSALEDYFKGTASGWHIRLPDAIPRQGYRLGIFKIRNANNLTFAFWKDHVAGSGDIIVVYAEPLCFNKWDHRRTTRIHYINNEDAHSALWRADENYFDEVSYPFVESGHIEARDLIGGWFSENALIKTQKAITRRMSDEEVTQGSLVALGSRLSNRVIRDILDHPRNRHLALRLHEDEHRIEYSSGNHRATIKHPTADELRRSINLGGSDGGRKQLDVYGTGSQSGEIQSSLPTPPPKPSPIVSWNICLKTGN
jgi:hypothetical protein